MLSLLKNAWHQRRLRQQGVPRPVRAELARLMSRGRASCTTTLLGPELELVDGPGFAVIYREIFLEESYRFIARTPGPLIIDCGANIGLSLIYFKRHYPDCRVIAFEPDPAIFPVLKRNMERFGFSDVELHQAAAWISDGRVELSLEGSISSKILKVPDAFPVAAVDATRLSDYLDQPVEFLKLDVEGVETELLESCASRLGNVENLFVEYHSYGQLPQTLDRILAVLTGAGFRYLIKEAFVPRLPFIEGPALAGNRLFDLQLEISAFRLPLAPAGTGKLE